MNAVQNVKPAVSELQEKLDIQTLGELDLWALMLTALDQG